MAALSWLLIPIIGAVAAGVWGTWANRRSSTGDAAGVAGYERFRAAMERSRGAESAPVPEAPVTPAEEPSEHRREPVAAAAQSVSHGPGRAAG